MASEIEAAYVKRVAAKLRDYDQCNDDDIDEAAKLLELLRDRLAADRAERGERARPIDAEWCLANGARHWTHGDEYVFDCGVRWGVHHGECETARGGVYLESVDGVSRIRSWVRLDSIKTCRQLGDLLRILKGGDE